MNRLLLDPGFPTFERDLLRSWSDEQPSAAARERAMSLATVAAGVAVVGASGAAGASAVGTSVAPKAMSGATLALVKWLTVGTAITAVGVGGAAYVQRDETPSTEAPAATATLRASPILAAKPTPLPEAAPALPSSVAAASTSAPATVARGRSLQTTAPTLGDEIASMDRVRSAIAAGDGVRAAQLVDDYERRFPRGTFTQEAEVLRVEALVLRGDRAAASRAAERFLASHPSSPHAPRLRAIVVPKEP